MASSWGSEALDWIIGQGRIPSHCWGTIPELRLGQDGSWGWNRNTDDPLYKGPTCQPINTFEWRWNSTATELEVANVESTRVGDSRSSIRIVVGDKRSEPPAEVMSGYESKYADEGRDLFARAMGGTVGASHQAEYEGKYSEAGSRPDPVAALAPVRTAPPTSRPASHRAPAVARRHPAAAATRQASAAPSGSAAGGDSTALSMLMGRLRAAFTAAGVTNFRMCRVKFKQMVYTHKNRLSQKELQDGLLETTGFRMSTAEARDLFHYLDHDRDGFVQLNELWAGVQGEMSPRRLAFVNQAFAIMDHDHDGVITLDDIRANYDASKHPKVISGEMTADAAFHEFISSFSVVGGDGKITLARWVEYYQQVVSPTIDSDDYFELMMRNAWHISGGEGWCANTTNRRVLVTAADGSESVREIRDDIAVARDDEETMRRNLAAQGVDDVRSLGHHFAMK